jgi:endogenous inhibitor of DNA gyrase (YacG/DUF329 family)
MNPQPQIQCPICKKPVNFFAEPEGPFCSNRCKMVDLGKWLGEEYSITEPLRPEHFASFEDLPDGPELDRPGGAANEADAEENG